MAGPFRHTIHKIDSRKHKLDRSNPRVADRFTHRNFHRGMIFYGGHRRCKNGQIVGVYIHDPLARINESDGWIGARFPRLIGRRSAFKTERAGFAYVWRGELRCSGLLRIIKFVSCSLCNGGINRSNRGSTGCYGTVLRFGNTQLPAFPQFPPPPFTFLCLTFFPNSPPQDSL